MLAAAMGVMVGMRNAVALTPTPAWVAGRFCVIAPARRCWCVQGERSWLMACAKVYALGQLEARYRRMRRVLRVTTAATLSSLMRSVSICAVASSVPCNANARSLSTST